MTLDDLERMLREAVHPDDLFGDDVTGNLEAFRTLCRADRHPGQERRAEAVLAGIERFARFSREEIEDLARAETVYQSLCPSDTEAQRPTITFHSPRRVYTVAEQIAIGGHSDIYLANADGRGFILKVARNPEGAYLLELEEERIAWLRGEAGETHYGAYVPSPVESFSVPDAWLRRINVYHHQPGLYTLEQVHRRHPALDGRHLAWIFKRLLTALGFVHRCNLVHGAIVPDHVLIHARTHGLRLVGWGRSAERGDPNRTVPTSYRQWYPREVRRREPSTPVTDIYMAAQCLVFLSGGDPATGRMPEAVPPRFAAFLRSCLLEGPRMRPEDAWALLDELDELLLDLYGTPQYHRLAMS